MATQDTPRQPATFRCRNFHTGCANRLSSPGQYCGTCLAIVHAQKKAEQAAIDAKCERMYIQISPTERWPLNNHCKRCRKPTLFSGLCYGCA